MKVTVFNGSPRGRKSNSHIIAQPLLEGARQAGAEVEEVFLIEKEILYCRGCLSCWGKTPGECVIKDDMSDLINLYLASDYAGLATPVYGMYMTGVLKTFTERMLPLQTPYIKKNDDGTFYHEDRMKRLPQQFFIANSGFPGEHNFDLLKAVMSMSPEGIVLQVYRNCGEALSPEGNDDPRLRQRLDEFRDALKKAGWEMVTHGRVSEETVQQIHMELLSDEEYMAEANRYWDQTLHQEPSADEQA